MLKRSIESVRAWQERSRLRALARPPKPRAPIRQTSRKRAAELREYAKVTATLRGGPCLARLPGCAGQMSDVNHVKPLGRGGAFTDPANHLPVCRPCHTWITEHPIEAHGMGLTLHSWETGGKHD